MPRPEDHEGLAIEALPEGREVKFWDSSAIIPPCLKKPASEAVKHVINADPDIMVWWATRTQCIYWQKAPMHGPSG